MRSGQAVFAGVLMLVLAASTPSARGAIVRLHSSVIVDKSLVTLGDVAEIFDNSEQEVARLQSLTLGTAPIPGNSARIRLDEVQSRLARFSVRVGAIEFQGSSVVLVTRRGQLSAPVRLARTPLAKPVARDSSPLPLRRTELIAQTSAVMSATPASATVPTADIRLAEDVIHDLVRDYLSEWAPDWGTPIIRPLLTVPTVPTILAARDGNLRIVAGKMLSDDLFLLAIEVPVEEAGSAQLASADPESTTRTVHVRVRVTRRPRVLTAGRLIPQGQIIQETDLEWLEVDSLKNGASDPETVVGMEARRTIHEGDFIQASSVRPATLIQRDELVKVSVQAGSIRVSRTLKARRSGILNDVIELVPLDRSDRTSIFARVTGKGRAEPIERDSNGGSSGLRLTISDK